MSVAVLGLGPMGRGILRNLVGAGAHPIVWNRTNPRVKDVDLAGVRIADTPAEAVATTVLSVLPDVEHFREVTGPDVWDGWRLAGVKRIVIMSTTSPERIRALESELAAHDIAVVDAPMSGGEAGARDGTMSIMVGARTADWDAVEPLLVTLGTGVHRFGDPGTGSVAKLCNQIVVAGTLGALAEALALAEHAGIDRDALCDSLAGGLASSAVLAAKRERLLTYGYTPSGSASNQLKDLRYIAELARNLGGIAPLAEVLERLFGEIVDAGRGGEDHTVVLERFRRPAS